MSVEQTTTSAIQSSSPSVYPSTSIPPVSIGETPPSTNNGPQATNENGNYTTSDVINSTTSASSTLTETIPYYPKVMTNNGQYSPKHNNSSPNDQPQQESSDISNSSQQPITETSPPNAFKAQITSTSLKPSNNGDEKGLNQSDQVEPSTSVQNTTPKATPKASQPRNRTPAKSRQKSATETRPPRSANQNSNAASTSGHTATKRPHPNQYTYQSSQASKDSRSVPYSRYNSNVPVPVSSQMHHNAQQVQYSIPASSYSSPKIYVQSQGPSSVSNSATYTVHPRPGTSTVSQRPGVTGASSGQPQVIIQCRPDQQPYSQGQTSNQHFIIQASDQPPTVYQQRTNVGGRPELQRQYIQTIQNGPPTQTSVTSTQGQQSSSQPQVLHIQLHHSGIPDQQKVQILQQAPNSSVQQQLMDKRLGSASNGPQQQAIGADSQISSSSTIQHHLHVSNQQLQRTKNIRTLAAQPALSTKQEEVFDDLSMHPAPILPLPDSFTAILDQINASGESPKAFYRRLKKQFKYLVYENECYQEELRNSQRHLLKLSRDKNFLLDRLLNYESAEEQSEESDADSDATIEEKIKPKKKKVQPPRKRNPPATSKKAVNKAIPKLEDENSQGSIDSGMANSQGAESFSRQFDATNASPR